MQVVQTHEQDSVYHPVPGSTLTRTPKETSWQHMLRAQALPVTVKHYISLCRTLLLAGCLPDKDASWNAISKPVCWRLFNCKLLDGIMKW